MRMKREISQGTLIGKETEYGFAYLGIPYARA